MAEQKHTIIIADSQFLTVDALVRIIEAQPHYSVKGVAESRESLVRILTSGQPDLLITDLNLMDFTGIEDLKSLLTLHSPMQILVLTNQLSPVEVKKLIKAGIRNIALKTEEREEILISVEMAVKARKHMSNQVLELIINESDSKTHPDDLSDLTSTEIEVIKLIANGFTTKEIAGKNHISAHTVMTHRKNIFRKLKISSISELTKFAIRNGLIDSIEYYI